MMDDLEETEVVVLPGEQINVPPSSGGRKTTIGVGLYENQKKDGNADISVVSHTTGILKKNRNAKNGSDSYWVDTNRTRYYAKLGDQVVGVIEEKGGDFYVVNIFSGFHCILSRLAFEGATKRSKPELKKGDVVYARVSAATDETNTLDTELSCLSPAGSKKEWTTGETIYGELPQGLLIRVSILKAKSMLKPDCAILNALGRHYCFECAIGMNGAIWVRSNDIVDLIVIRNAILNSEYLDDEAQIIAMVEKLTQLSKRLKKS
jgi:exosome complex component RRP40